MMRLLIVITLLSACNLKEKRSATYYFDTDSLMTLQKKALAERGAAIRKVADINNAKDTSYIIPDSLQSWNNEFQIFNKLNINKPVLRGVYAVSEYEDTQSNLTIREYSTDQKKVEVLYLKLYYLDKIENLRQIEAQYRESNPVYQSHRDIKMVFDDFIGTPLLHKYSIKGTQKMLMKDSVQFVINGEIDLQPK